VQITFKSDIKKRRKFFTPEHFAHPAKMHLGLALWIVGKYSQPGELILDPMAGAGTTMIATTLGRNVVLVDLEEKFIKMMQDNWEKLKTDGYAIGNCQILQGDARNLSNLWADVCFFSPPYAETEASQRLPNTEVSKGGQTRYYHQELSIGNLSYGDVDKIITSPPFQRQMQDTEWMRQNKPSKHRGSKGGDYLDAIGDLPYGEVDKIITSPPYEGICETTHASLEAEEGKVYQDKRPGREGTKWEFTGQKKERYSNSTNNIGNLKSQTYLEAMLQVYQQCYEVLKPDGLMILVTKDFIRNKKRVFLSIDTLKLCEQVGFVLEDWHERKLTQQSFWRVIYKKKYPDAPTIDTEDILVFKKREGKGEVDKIITSPPYLTFGASRAGEKIRTGQSKIHREKSLPTTYTREQTDNIGNLPYGSVDSILCSPPYADTGHSQGDSEMQRDIIDKKHTWAGQEYSDNPDNIGNLPYGEVR